MTTLDRETLANVLGGARGQSRQQISERYQNECLSPDARQHYDTMLQRMVPDSSEARGIKRRVVKSVADLCGWPFPGDQANGAR